MSSFRLVPRLLPAAIALACAAPLAFAQSQTVVVEGTAIDGDARLPLDGSQRTGSRLNLAPRDTAATIHVIDRDFIDALGARDTLETLQGAPGVIADASPGGGGSVSYRGFSSSQVMQLFNGIDVAYVIAAHPVDAWLLDRTEVLGGSASFMYGQGGVGGAINYVSKLPTRQPLRQDYQLGAGSFGAWQAAYDLDGRLAPGSAHAVRVAFSQQGWDGYVDNTDGDSTVLTAAWLADLSPRVSHTLAVEHQHKAHTPYWGTPLLNPTVEGRIDPRTRFKNYNAADGAYEQTVLWLRSITEVRLSDATQITNTIYHYDADRDYRNVETYRFNATNTAVIRSNTLLQRHGQSLIGNRLELTHAGTIGGLASQWAVGLDWSRNTQTRYPTSLSAVVSTVDPYDFTTEHFFDIPGISHTWLPDRDNRLRTLALFAENHTRLGGGWSLLAGLRTEKIMLDVHNFRAVNAANPAYFEVEYTPTTGRIGVMHEFSRHANAYLTYSTAADPPSGILTTTNFGSVKDWDLTSGRQLELGSKLDFLDGRGNATIAIYQLERENLAMPDPAAPSTNTIPVGKQSSQGIEIAAGLALNADWSIRGDIALVDAQYDKFVQNVGGVAISRAGNQPTFVPEQVANLHVGWRFAPAWHAGLDVRHVAARFGNVENTQRFDGYTLVGLNVSWKAGKQSTLTLRGRNLGDEIYVASGTTQPRLGEPRAWELTWRSAF